MAVYLRPYAGEPIATADELREAAKLLSAHDYSLSLIRAINGEALVREGARTRKGRTIVRLILAFFDFESWLTYDVLDHIPVLHRLPTWRLANRLQGVRGWVKAHGW